MKLNPDHGLNKWNLIVERLSEKRIRRRGWLDPRSKLKEIQSTIGTHKTVVYGPLIDWKRKTGLDYKRDVCDALVVSRPWNDCLL